MNFIKFPVEVNIVPLLEQMEQYPKLWDFYQERKSGPHAQMSDIWLRYRAKEELNGPEDFKGMHIPVWYPTRKLLPQAEIICMDLMAYFRAVQLGGVLITKIPPGGKILPHNDKGTWHPEFFNLKVYVPLKSNDKCLNKCENDTAVMLPGECWSFDNLKEHSVENNSDEDRITMIVCLRVERGNDEP